MNYWLLLIPLLTAFVGWFVIRLVLVSLFRPRRPKTIAGIRLQGIIAANQKDLAMLAGIAADNAFKGFGLEQKINDPANFEKVRPVIEEHVDDFLRNKLKEQMPMISMFIGDKTIVSLKTVFLKEIESLFPQVLGKFAGNLQEDLQVGSMVSAKINAISPLQIEQMLFPRLKRAFRMAAIGGALIGLLVGVLQLIIIRFLA